jgi:hypothetical protein
MHDDKSGTQTGWHNVAGSRDLDRERANVVATANSELMVRDTDLKSRSRKAINTLKAESYERSGKRQVDHMNHGDLLRNGKMNVQTAYGN